MLGIVGVANKSRLKKNTKYKPYINAKQSNHIQFFILVAIMNPCKEDTVSVTKPVSDKITMNINGKNWTADNTSLTLSVNKNFISVDDIVRAKYTKHKKPNWINN